MDRITGLGSLLSCCMNTGWCWEITFQPKMSWGWPPKDYGCVCLMSRSKNCYTSLSHMRWVCLVLVESHLTADRFWRIKGLNRIFYPGLDTNVFVAVCRDAIFSLNCFYCIPDLSMGHFASRWSRTESSSWMTKQWPSLSSKRSLASFCISQIWRRWSIFRSNYKLLKFASCLFRIFMLDCVFLFWYQQHQFPFSSPKTNPLKGWTQSHVPSVLGHWDRRWGFVI